MRNLRSKKIKKYPQKRVFSILDRKNFKNYECYKNSVFSFVFSIENRITLPDLKNKVLCSVFSTILTIFIECKKGFEKINS